MKADEIDNPGCSCSSHLLCYIYILQGPTGYVCCLVRKKENVSGKPAKLVVFCHCQNKLATIGRTEKIAVLSEWRSCL